jgi:hypothetical protein
MQEIEAQKENQDYKNKKMTKRQNFKDKKKAYIQAKAAYQACLGVDSDEEQDSMDSDNDEGSNQSDTSYSSEGSNTS